MKGSIILISLCWLSVSQCANIGKKYLDGNAKSTKSKVQETEGKPPAILAIEIVNSDDNSTEPTKNTKRTIESALGYGYQNSYNSQNNKIRYMVYPYSQHDIPASYGNRGAGNGNFELQKSIAYTLGSVTSKHVPQSAEVHRPTYTPPTLGYFPSTLYSTVQGNHLAGLSSHISNPGYAGYQQHIPVIVLRVYTNQLTTSGDGLYANLPSSNPYASYLNSLNLQALLSQYLQQQYQTQHYQTQPQPTQQVYYQNYQQEYPQEYQQQYEYQYQYEPKEYQYDTKEYQYQQSQVQPDHKLETSENYPGADHTKVVFHKGQQYQTGQTKSPKQVPSTPTVQYYIPTKSHYATQSPKTQYVYATGTSATPAYEQYSQLEYQYQETQTQVPQHQYQQQVVYYQQQQQPSTGGQKHYNYHSVAGDRSKKSSGAPVTFDAQTKTKRTSA